MPTLYALTDKYRELEALAEACDDGELDPDLLDAINENEDDIRIKVDGYGRLIRNLQSEAAACKAEETRLSQRRKARENTVERLKAALEEGMVAIGTDSIKTDLFSVRIQPNPPSVFVCDEKAVPPEYWEPQPPKLLKSKIAEDLKRGAEVPGAELTRGKSLRIR